MIRVHVLDVPLFPSALILSFPRWEVEHRRYAHFLERCNEVSKRVAKYTTEPTSPVQPQFLTMPKDQETLLRVWRTHSCGIHSRWWQWCTNYDNNRHILGDFDAFTKIFSEEGAVLLLKRLGVISSGYFLYGALKYSVKEVFKVLLYPYSKMSVNQLLDIGVFSGFCTECVNCMLLYLVEAIRMRYHLSTGRHVRPICLAQIQRHLRLLQRPYRHALEKKPMNCPPIRLFWQNDTWKNDTPSKILLVSDVWVRRLARES